MDCHEGEGENLGILHHAPALGVGARSEHFGVPGVGDAGHRQGFLVDGGCGDRVDMPFQCGIDGTLDVGVAGSACLGIHAPGSPVSAHFGLNIQDQRILGPVLDEIQGMLGSAWCHRCYFRLERYPQEIGTLPENIDITKDNGNTRLIDFRSKQSPETDFWSDACRVPHGDGNDGFV